MKIKLWAFLMLCVLWSCDSSEPQMDFTSHTEDFESAFDEPEPDSVIVNSYELNRVFNRYGKVSSRSYDMEIIRDIQGNPAIYVMNYENDGGFVLVSAKKDCPPVLAYNHKGHFAVNTGVEPVQDWLSENAEIVNHAGDYIPADTISFFRNLWFDTRTNA